MVRRSLELPLIHLMESEIVTDINPPDVNEVALVPKLQSKRPRSHGKRTKLSCLTVFLSDIHLGTAESKADEVVEFLKHIRCRKLVLNGDIIDGWALRRGGGAGVPVTAG